MLPSVFGFHAFEVKEFGDALVVGLQQLRIDLLADGGAGDLGETPCLAKERPPSQRVRQEDPGSRRAGARVGKQLGQTAQNRRPGRGAPRPPPGVRTSARSSHSTWQRSAADDLVARRQRR